MKLSPITPKLINFESKKRFKRMFKTCAYSGDKFTAEDKRSIEHIIPKSRGGENDYSNYLVVKTSLNSERSSQPLDEYLKDHPETEENIRKTVLEHEGEKVEGKEWSKAVRETLIKAIGRDIFKV